MGWDSDPSNRPDQGFRRFEARRLQGHGPLQSTAKGAFQGSEHVRAGPRQQRSKKRAFLGRRSVRHKLEKPLCFLPKPKGLSRRRPRVRVPSLPPLFQGLRRRGLFVHPRRLASIMVRRVARLRVAHRARWLSFAATASITPARRKSRRAASRVQ
jgi:hypothetical protein